MFRKFFSYFNLNIPIYPKSEINTMSDNSNPVWPQYVALVAGIIAQPLLQYFTINKQMPSDISKYFTGILISIIIGIVIFPQVYKRSWDNSNPLFVQLCSIFSYGIGWQTLLSAVPALTGN